MPELPEVETIRRQIEKLLPLTICNIETSIFSKSIFKSNLNATRVRKILKSNKIVNINRKGKLLMFEMENDFFILSRLGMTGSWRFAPNKIIEKHTHIQFICQSSVGQELIYLAYIDPRRFGSFDLVNREDCQQELRALGSDIASSEFTTNYIKKVFDQHENSALKPLLLEQKLFAGIGNYIACEICARSNIHPERQIKNIKKQEILKIKQATKTVVRKALKAQGTSFSTFTNAEGKKGKGANHLVVYNQKQCGLCGKEVIKITQKTRSTFFCPACQK